MSDPGFDDDVYERLAAISSPVQLLAGEELTDAEVAGLIGVVSAGRVAVVVEAEAGRSRTIALLQEGDALALPGGGWAGAPGAREEKAVGPAPPARPTAAGRVAREPRVPEGFTCKSGVFHPTPPATPGCAACPGNRAGKRELPRGGSSLTWTHTDSRSSPPHPWRPQQAPQGCRPRTT
jgi:hypothetical protein